MKTDPETKSWNQLAHRELKKVYAMKFRQSQITEDWSGKPYSKPMKCYLTTHFTIVEQEPLAHTRGFYSVTHRHTNKALAHELTLVDAKLLVSILSEQFSWGELKPGTLRGARHIVEFFTQNSWGSLRTHLQS